MLVQRCECAAELRDDVVVSDSDQTKAIGARLLQTIRTGAAMHKASGRGFGFSFIAIFVVLMALSAMWTSAEAACLLL